MQKISYRIANAEIFQRFILCLIVFNALCMGVEATPPLAEIHSGWLYEIFFISQTIFIVEISIRLFAYYPGLGRFFDDSWNTFDFVIIILSLLPAIGGFTLVARLLRVLRILRVVSVSDTLRGYFKGSDIGYSAPGLTIVLLIIMNYIFALMGFYIFGEFMPDQWGTLGRSLMSLWYLISLQGVPSYLSPVYEKSVFLLIYFFIFYLINMSILVSALISRYMLKSGRNP